jgi:chaperonin cofactor prefoldin
MIKEPKQACPLIDKAIKIFKRWEDEIKDECYALRREDLSCDSATNILNLFFDMDFIETLEELRSRCSDLREWGKQWESEVERLEAELEELKEKLDD